MSVDKAVILCIESEPCWCYCSCSKHQSLNLVLVCCLQDVAEKLCLPSADDAEYICAKAIRDGGIDAVLDHEGGFLATRELTDLYSTSEPQVGEVRSLASTDVACSERW